MSSYGKDPDGPCTCPNDCKVTRHSHGLDEKAPKPVLGDRPPIQWKRTDAQGNPDENGQYVNPHVHSSMEAV